MKLRDEYTLMTGAVQYWCDAPFPGCWDCVSIARRADEERLL